MVPLYVDFDLIVDFDFGQRPGTGRYKRLSNFLLCNGYERGMIDKTLFIKKSNSEIIFGPNLC